MIADQGAHGITGEADIVETRRIVRELTKEVGFGFTDVTRIVTAISELARNVVIHAESGRLYWKLIGGGVRQGIELIVEDQGPGISDIEMAMQEGFSTGRGMGVGLPGTKRLMDEMEIITKEGEGTKIVVRKWLRGR